MRRDLIGVKILIETIRNSQKVALKCYGKYRLVEKIIRKDSNEGTRPLIYSTCDCLSPREEWNSYAGENGDNSEWVRKHC